LYVERSEKCHLYSVENHEVGTRAQPTFLKEVDEAVCCKDGNGEMTLWCLML
ncbi:unnamed protein product, partial [Porites lobata]